MSDLRRICTPGYHPLGAEPPIRHIYSYPNNSNEVGFLSQSLEQTIPPPNPSRRPCAPDPFRRRRSRVRHGAPASLAAGAVALKASIALNTAKKWLYNWRLVLPHGLAIVRHRSVQLLHFPPDCVLERDQD